MLSSLFPDIPWSRIKCVGFDLDGTLYDEFDFIRQVYREILRQTENCFPDVSRAYAFMLKRWLEKGGAYTHIFEEVFKSHGVPHSTPEEEFVKHALNLYRNYSPDLTLTERSLFILEVLTNGFDSFLLSDGPPALQRNKFNSLGLGDIFPESRVVFTGDHGKTSYKPHPATFHDLAERSGWRYKPEEIVYFGDRDVDEAFCRNLGIQFQRVYNMVPR